MSSKENLQDEMKDIRVKPEPTDHDFAPFSNASRRQNITSLSRSKQLVKPEASDESKLLKTEDSESPSHLHTVKAEPSKSPVKKNESVVYVPPHQTIAYSIPPYVAKYALASDIRYTPEECLKEGVEMVKNIKAHVQCMELGSKLRKDVWLKEIANLESQGAPTTMIAVCGATGAGKSSILNAILDDNIVPTSGMRACTAVVTEISYHKDKVIAADVSFLSEKEWRDELTVLLDDLTDEDGSIKRSTDLRSEAGVAWHKVHAVYPVLTQDRLARIKSVDDLLLLDPKITRLLGSVKKIVAKNSKEFAKEIARYIDSKDQKRGGKKDKEKEKKRDDYGPALWPLIRQVNVRCNANALSTGSILVDLPGVADANAARSSIAKDYMKKCDCIWILAPITRAVDDKTAKDLLGDAFKSQLMSKSCSNFLNHLRKDGGFADVEGTITFIATKCDDISCNEVIRALSLDDHPVLEEIEERLDHIRGETKVWKAKKGEAEKSGKIVTEDLKSIRAVIADHQEHLKALEEGVPFNPKEDVKKSNKRKNSRGGKKASPKRRKGGINSEEEEELRTDPDADEDKDGMDIDSLDDFIDDDSIASADSDNEGDEDVDSEGKDSDDSDDDNKSNKTDDNNVEEVDEFEEIETITEDKLKTKIAEKKEVLKEARIRLSEARKLKKEAMDAISNLEKKKTETQREKNAFCSLKRSEFSRDVLKEDFRAGIKELDDADAEKRNPSTFDPTVDLRDYASIDLPTFTVSARDYVRIKKQVKGDGAPTCFINPEDTGVPALQKWCHTLTIKSRERAARVFRNHIQVFAKSVKSYVESIGTVGVYDREALREQWETQEQLFSINSDGGDDGDDGTQYVLQRGRLVPVISRHSPWRSSPLNTGHAQAEADENPHGVSKKLTKELRRVVVENVKRMQSLFKNGLEEKCQVGAESAAESAVEVSDAFAASMHWATYRATLRREGSWRRDLNEELITPMTRHIASSWAQLFESDLFSDFEDKAIRAVMNLLEEFETSCPLGLRDRARCQEKLCIEEVKVALKNTVEVVSEQLTTGQKDVSRCLAPNVREQLCDGYHRAMEERGRGSVTRQKTVFHSYVDVNRGELFENGVDVILDRLDKVAVAVGTALEGALKELADKVEVNLAVLWEGGTDHSYLAVERIQAIESINTILRQLSFWQAADR